MEEARETFVKENYETGELYMQYSILNNKLHGIYMLFYKSGRLAQQSTYKNGVLHGSLLEFYDIDYGNKIKKTCNYIDGKLSGQVKEFIIGKHHEDLITSTYVNGVLHGLHTIETSIKGEIDHYFIYNKYENGVLIETSEE